MLWPSLSFFCAVERGSWLVAKGSLSQSVRSHIYRNLSRVFLEKKTSLFSLVVWDAANRYLPTSDQKWQIYPIKKKCGARLVARPTLTNQEPYRFPLIAKSLLKVIIRCEREREIVLLNVTWIWCKLKLSPICLSFYAAIVWLRMVSLRFYSKDFYANNDWINKKET